MASVNKAVVENGIVVNVIVIDEAAETHDGHTLVALSGSVVIGWSYDGEEFSPLEEG